MSASPLALCAVAFVAIAGWLFLSPSDDKQDSKPERRRSRDDDANDRDIKDLLKRAPPPPESRERRSSDADTPSSQAVGPANPVVRNPDHHLKEYEARDSFKRETTGKPEKPSLRYVNPNNPIAKTPIKPSANGRSVAFAGGENGTAATSIASRPAEESEMGADLRLWDENQELSHHVDKHQLRVAAEGEPEALKALDGSCSPLRLRPGVLPVGVEAMMKDIEHFCSQDWLRHRNEEENKQWAKCLMDSPHAIYGNAPYWICEVVAALVPLVPLDPLFEVLELVVPPFQPYSPVQILEKGQDPHHDILLSFFMIPFRAHVDIEWWPEPDKYDKRGDPRSPAAQIRAAIRAAVGEVGEVAIEWLHYIARPFLISRMFAGRRAELLDGSAGIAIFANAALKGYIAEITLFAPVRLPDGTLALRGWQILQAERGPMIRYALGRCLNLARQWIEYRFADPSGTDRFGYRLGGDPLVWNRLCIRPGHVIDPSRLEATTNAGRVGTLPKPHAAAQQIPMNQAHIHGMLREQLQKSVPIFRQIVELTRPARLSFNNNRQNAWHSDVQGKEQFDGASFCFMWMLCSLALKWKASVGFKKGEGGEEIEEVIGQSSTFEQLDMGGIMPYIAEYDGHGRIIKSSCFDLSLFPGVKTIVLPFIPIDADLNDLKPSTASLLVDPKWGLQEHFIPSTSTQSKSQRQPIEIVVIMPPSSLAQSIFDDLRNTIKARATQGAFKDRPDDVDKPRRRQLELLCRAINERVLLIEESKYRRDLIQWPYHPPTDWERYHLSYQEFIDKSGEPRKGDKTGGKEVAFAEA